MRVRECHECGVWRNPPRARIYRRHGPHCMRMWEVIALNDTAAIELDDDYV